MAKQYEGFAQFLFVYIKEAHPSDDWASKVEDELAYIKDPTSDLERMQVASTCVTNLDIKFPCFLDDMGNTTAREYKAWPGRFFIVNTDGTLAYVGDPGPRGLLPHHMEAALVKMLRKRTVSSGRPPWERLDENTSASSAGVDERTGTGLNRLPGQRRGLHGDEKPGID